MAQFKNYYKILSVDPDAEPDIIDAAFKKLSSKYHPDTNKDPEAEEKYKEITEAHHILKDHDKRSNYDKEYKNYYKPKPILNVDKYHILFDNITPGEVKTDSFVIRNIGGNYENIEVLVETPNSWLKITGLNSLDPNQSDELPLRVELEASADDWDKNYIEYIVVKLDEEEIRIKVELNTKTKGQQTSNFNKKKIIPIIVFTILFLVFSCAGIYYSVNSCSKTRETGNNIIEEKTISSNITSSGEKDEKPVEMEWQQVGLSGESISDLLVVNSDILYAATSGLNHGIFKSSDGGNTWNAINNGLGSLEVYDIDVYSDDFNKVVAGTDKGLWFTQNGGRYWQPIGPTNYQNLSIISVSVLEPSTIIAVGPANYGAYISYDNGINWQEVYYKDASGDNIFWNLSLRITQSVIEPSQIIYLIGYSKIFRSSDGGQSWFRVANVGANYNVYSFTIDQKNGNISYAMTFDYELCGLYKSTDGGGSWIPINNGLPNQYNYSEDSALAINPGNSNNIYIAIDGQIYESYDGGESWFQLPNFPDDLWPVKSMAINSVKNTLNIGTNQNGIWYILLKTGINSNQNTATTTTSIETVTNPTQNQTSIEAPDIEYIKEKVKQYYDNKGEWAGAYVISSIEKVILETKSESEIIAHVHYNYEPAPSSVRSDTGNDKRTFFFQYIGSDWIIIEMGGHMSGSL